jgi:uncharacterized membrane protein (DUF106 family)
MFTLLLTATISILFGIFATQNTGLVTLNFGGYFLPTLPIYLAILIPVLLTLVVALGIQIIRNLSTILTLRSQKNTIKTLKRELAEVTKSLHKSELENVKFKAETGQPDDVNSI